PQRQTITMSKISVPSTGKPSDQNSREKTEAGLWPATGVNPRVQSKPSTIKWPRVRSRRKISSTGASTNSQKNRLRVTRRRSCEPVFILYSGSRCPQAAAVSSGFGRQRRGLVVRTSGDNKAVQIHQYTNTKGHTTPLTRPVDRHNNVLSGHVA